MKKKDYFAGLIVFSALFILVYIILVSSNIKTRYKILPSDFSLAGRAQVQNAYHKASKVYRRLASYLGRSLGMAFTERTVDGLASGAVSIQQILQKFSQQLPKWQPVNESLGLHVYSAFYDDIEYPQLRLIGMGYVKYFPKPRKVFCHLWNKTTDSKPRLQEGLVRPLAPWKAQSYMAVFILCSTTQGERPFAVSITTKGNNYTNWVPVKYPGPKRNFTVCFPSVSWGYTNVYELVQTIEIDRLMGAEKHFIYNLKARPYIRRALQAYQDDGLLEVLDWKLPGNGSVYYGGQNIAINECMYRNLHESEFVAIKDLDEVLVPIKHKNWTELMEFVKKREDFHNYDAIMFRNKFFWKTFPDDLKDYAFANLTKKYKIQALSKIWRHNKIWPAGSRSKIFVVPSKTLIVGVHKVLKPRGKNYTYVLENRIGGLYHYRQQLSPLMLDPHNMTHEPTLRRYSKEITTNVGKMLDRLNMINDDPRKEKKSAGKASSKSSKNSRKSKTEKSTKAGKPNERASKPKAPKAKNSGKPNKVTRKSQAANPKDVKPQKAKKQD